MNNLRSTVYSFIHLFAFRSTDFLIMSEVIEKEMELENAEFGTYKAEDGDFCPDEIEKKSLIQPDEVEKLDEISDKTT